VQDHILVQGMEVELWQNAIVKEFDAVQNRQTLPEFFVLMTEVITTGS
jgi:hypothetical protein